MDEAGPYVSIIVFFLLLILYVIYYGFGAAIHNLNASDIEKKASEKGERRARRILVILKNPAQHMNTVQLVVTLISFIMGWYYMELWREYLEFVIPHPEISFGIATVLMLYVLLTFGVLLPKKLGTRYPEKWTFACVNLIYLMTRLLSPFTYIVMVSTQGIFRVIGLKSDDDLYDVTEEEIISMVNEGQEQGVLQASEAEMIANIFEFGDKEASDIMTNRQNIVAVDGKTKLRECIHYMLQERISRYPVFEDNLDHIIGIIHFKDAMRAHAENEKLDCPIEEIEGLIREANFIPETRNIDLLFKEMQSSKYQMVIVVDEYGQTSGLVAMEDILEEIVGNILDEYDEDDEYIEETGNDEYLIEGMTPLDELEEKLNISFHEEEFDTLNGFLISRMEHIPDEGEEFEINVDDYNFKVLTVENKMIQTVLVRKITCTEDMQTTDLEMK